jgi:hypothetical protein
MNNDRVQTYRRIVSTMFNDGVINMGRVHIKDPTPLYNFNYLINTNIYNNEFFKENQFKRKSTRYIDLNLTIVSFIFN